MSRKSVTCIGKVSGEPLTEYDTQNEAEDGAAYARASYGRDLVPYRCRHCRLWHLAPADRQTPSHDCGSCVGSDGRPKATYRTADDAERRAEILRRERGAWLRVYPCPHGSGWHLTKSMR